MDPEVATVLRQYCELTPKVDIHAHINGSIPPAVLENFLREQLAFESEAKKQASMTVMPRRDELMAVRDPKDRMERCFAVFDAVYSVVDRIERCKKVVWAVLLAYHEERTIYLELRTSLRKVLPHDGACQEAYLRCVLETIDAFDAWQQVQEAHDFFMTVRLLVSINRGAAVAEAESTINLALSLYEKQKQQCIEPRIVGVDFCGNCYKGVWKDFVPCLSRARAAGLKLSLHVGEKDDNDELEQMLKFSPDRIGHLVFADENCQQMVREKSIPLEFCITSNLMTTDWMVRDHHVKWWYKSETANTPTCDPVPSSISINTDDRGVFDTSMTEELFLFVQCLFERDMLEGNQMHMSKEQLVIFYANCIRHVQRTTIERQAFGLSRDTRAKILEQYDIFESDARRKCICAMSA